MSFITDSFGNKGGDIGGGPGGQPDGKLQPWEIDIKAGGKELASGYDSSGRLRQDDWSKSQTLGDMLENINNGRVSDISVISQTNVKLPQDIVLNKDNQATAVKGIVEETALSQYFFSDMNQKALNDLIIYRVHKLTKLMIKPGNISKNELYIVMRSILLQHANFKVSSKDLVTEIQKLNNLVAKYSVEEISSNLLQYKRYKTDLERLPTPMDRPSYGGKNHAQYDTSNLMG